MHIIRLVDLGRNRFWDNLTNNTKHLVDSTFSINAYSYVFKIQFTNNQNGGNVDNIFDKLGLSCAKLSSSWLQAELKLD